ncbi:MAG: hypothetical protein IPF43_06010 [Arcobacter sp.]|nr:hypothetical protein [Arcobacter sp.]
MQLQLLVADGLLSKLEKNTDIINKKKLFKQMLLDMVNFFKKNASAGANAATSVMEQ